MYLGGTPPPLLLMSTTAAADVASADDDDGDDGDGGDGFLPPGCRANGWGRSAKQQLENSVRGTAARAGRGGQDRIG